MTRVRKLSSVFKSRSSTVTATIAASKKRPAPSAIASTSSTSKNNSKNNVFSRLGHHVSCADARIGVRKRVEAALAKGALVGKHLIVGFLAVNRFFEKRFNSMQDDDANAVECEVAPTQAGVVAEWDGAPHSSPNGKIHNNNNNSNNKEKRPRGAQTHNAARDTLCVCKDAPTA